MAVRARPLAQLLLALLLTGSAAVCAHAESDWIESVFPVLEPVLKTVRKPPAKPERLVKRAPNRNKGDSQTARTREKQQDRKQAEYLAEAHKADANAAKGRWAAPLPEPSSALQKAVAASTQPGVAKTLSSTSSVQPVPVVSPGAAAAAALPAPQASPQVAAANDDASKRMRLGGTKPLEPMASTTRAPAPIVLPSWLPAATFANPAAGPAVVRQEASKPATSATAGGDPALSEINKSSTLAYGSAKPRDSEIAAPNRPAESASATAPTSAGATVTVAAVVQAARAVALPPPPTDALEPEARAAAIARGQRLWLQRRGTRHASLEECDLGLGPGRVVGTFAHLPRYFPDANRVMDLEARIAWCARVQQDLSVESLLKPQTVDGVLVTEMEDLAVYVASLSASWRLSPPLAHAKEQLAYDVGQALYARRQGPLDFSCATCHGTAVPGTEVPSGSDPQANTRGQPIRFWQGRPVPQLGTPAESQASIGNWPAWRAAHGGIQTLQVRIGACFGHMGVEPPAPGSDAAVALAAYLTRQAEKGEVLAPGRKR